MPHNSRQSCFRFIVDSGLNAVCYSDSILRIMVFFVLIVCVRCQDPFVTSMADLNMTIPAASKLFVWLKLN